MLEQSDDEFRESVCQNLGTSLEQVKSDVQTLRKWIRSQPHLPQCATNTLLTSFLIGNKNRIDKTKEKLEHYFAARSRIPEFFGDRDPLGDDVQDNCKAMRLFYLPMKTQDGCRVQVTEVVADPKQFNLAAVMKRALMIEDVRYNREAFTNGTYVIYDAANVSISHILKLTPKTCRDTFYCIQGVIPQVLKAVIVINAPAAMSVVMTVIKPFLKKKLFERFQLHTEGYEILGKYFPLDILPKDFGGEEETSYKLNENWMRCLESNRDWLMNEGAEKIDDTDRGKLKPLLAKIEEISTKDIKSFRNLCID